MNIVINNFYNKNYNNYQFVTFKARIPKDSALINSLTDNKTISIHSNITVEEFKKVFLDMTLSLRQKSKKLDVPVTTLRNWAKKIGIKQEQKLNPLVEVTKEQFDKIYSLDISEKEKYELLGLKPKQYYKKLLEYGYTAKRTAKEKEISKISREAFEQVFFDNTLTEQEKHKKLGLSHHTYLNKAKEFGLKTDKKENDERIASISKEEYDKVFFDKHLGIRHKLKILGINHSTFIKYARKYEYKTDMQLRLEYLKSITKEQFDSIFYAKNLTKQEKQERLKINDRLYRLFAVKFGHASEITDNIPITIHEFDKVFFDKTLSRKEKISKLNVNEDDYYYLIAKFGYKTERQKQSSYIDKISKERFLEVASNPNLSEEEKCKELKISIKTLSKLSKKYGYKSERTEQKEHIKNITKEKYIEIYNDKNLSEKDKHEKLDISANVYRDRVNDYGYITNVQKENKNVEGITREEFDKIYNDPNLLVKEKCEKLNISNATYQRLLKIFGYKEF